MWISWSWSTVATGDDENENKFSGNKLKDHPVVTFFERSNVLSKIEVTRLRSKRRLCFTQLDAHLPEVLWECNDLEKLYLARNSIRKVPNCDILIRTQKGLTVF